MFLVGPQHYFWITKVLNIFIFHCILNHVLFNGVIALKASRHVFVFAVKEVDNTVTTIIVSVLGGVIGLIILIMVVKAVVLAILSKVQEKK